MKLQQNNFVLYTDQNGELRQDATISILKIVQQEGHRSVKRKLTFYNLDAIIAVGYRVNSKRATQFRIWATKVSNKYIITDKEYSEFNKTPKNTI